MGERQGQSVIPTVSAEGAEVEESFNSPFMRKPRSYYVYIMASINRVLYIGVTGNLVKRVCQHKNHIFKGFTDQYQCHKLVHVEEYSSIYDALSREKQLKRWRREKKEDLIFRDNLSWKDLAADWY